MSSYASLYLGLGLRLLTFRNGVDELFFGIFCLDDWIELQGVKAKPFVADLYDNGPEDEEGRLVGFQARAGDLRDRLDIMDVNWASLLRSFDELKRSDAEMGTYSDLLSLEEFGREWESERVAVANLDLDEWIRSFRARIDAGDRLDRPEGRTIGTLSWLMSLWQDFDPRTQLRAVLAAVPADEIITIDLADLMEGGWIAPHIDPRTFSREYTNYALRGGLEPIVLTEGTFDAEVLEAAIRLRRPHLVDFIQFPDFTGRPEGGAAALRQTVRAFAAAKIPNRVVALFDSDTAARDVTRSIRLSELPQNLRVTHLPALNLGLDYPTIGPQGFSRMNVNGLAGSIELYLGRDCLIVASHDNGDSNSHDPSMELSPVHWRGYFEKLAAYQGEVASKRSVQEAFRTKVAEARADPSAMGRQDWSGMDLVIDHLLHELST